MRRHLPTLEDSLTTPKSRYSLAREEDYKKKIRELESQMENNLYDAETEKRSW